MIREYDGKLGKFSYDDEEYIIIRSINGPVLRYFGNLINEHVIKPSQPKGCKCFYTTFAYRKFEVIDLSDWDMSDVEIIVFMFRGCSNLKEIKGVENWDRIKESALAFNGCHKDLITPSWYKEDPEN